MALAVVVLAAVLSHRPVRDSQEVVEALVSNALSDALRDKALNWNKDKKVRWATPGELAATVNPKTVRTPALDLVDQALVKVRDTPDSRPTRLSATSTTTGRRRANRLPRPTTRR